jgi:hypothetical protein
MPWNQLLLLPSVGEGEVLKASSAFRQTLILRWRVELQRYLTNLARIDREHTEERKRTNRYQGRLEESLRKNLLQLQQLGREKELLVRRNRESRQEIEFLRNAATESTARNRYLMETTRQEREGRSGGQRKKERKTEEVESELRRQIQAFRRVSGDLERCSNMLRIRDMMMDQLARKNGELAKTVEEKRGEIFLLRHTIETMRKPIPQHSTFLTPSPYLGQPLTTWMAPPSQPLKTKVALQRRTQTTTGPLTEIPPPPPELVEMPAPGSQLLPFKKRRDTRVPPPPTLTPSPASATLLLKRYHQRTEVLGQGKYDPVLDAEIPSATDKKGGKGLLPAQRATLSALRKMLHPGGTPSTSNQIPRVWVRETEAEQQSRLLTQLPPHLSVVRVEGSEVKVEEGANLSATKIFPQYVTLLGKIVHRAVKGK